MHKDFLVALSLANLIFIEIWQEVFSQHPYYYESNVSPTNGPKAVIFNVFLLTLIIWGGIRLVRKSASPVIETAGCALFALLLIFALNGIRHLLLPVSWLDSLLKPFDKVAVFLLAGVTLGAIVFYAWVPARRYLVRAVATLLLVLSPFALFQLGRAAHRWYNEAGVFAKDKPPASVLPTRSPMSPRIVWVVFDELDYHLVSAERPASLQLREFDRLRTESIEANHVFPAANFTVQAMPSFITGRVVIEAEPARRDELLLFFSDRKKGVGWSTLPNIFSMARNAGFNTGLAGWFHPYCRILGDDLNTCFSQLQGADEMSVADVTLDQALAVLSKTPLLHSLVDSRRLLLKKYKQRYLRYFRNVMTHAKQLAVDPSLGLVLIHYPIPHPPGIYDRRSDEFSTEPGGNYLDNCWLADRALGELRQAMEEAGLWDKTVVLVTSDHHWRPGEWKPRADWTAEEAALADSLQTADHRVPYFLKLAGQTQAHRYDKPLNSVISHDLLLALLREELASADSVLMWLDQHHRGESFQQ
jgi:Sulfatase